MTSSTGVPPAPRSQRLRQGLAYLVVGGLSYLLDVGLLVGSREWLDAPLWLATTIGFWTSVLFNFFASRWVFATEGSLHGHALRYCLLLGFNYVLTLGIVQLGVTLGGSAVVAKTLAVALIACSNFVLYRRWVFA